MKSKYPNNYFKDKTCPTCAITYTPIAPSQKYCSNDCRGNNSYYKRNYGITESRYREMKEEQGDRCALCGGEGFIMNSKRHKERLCVDHDHETGKVRGLLCHNCNRALGLLQDKPELMRKAANYVEKHKE